MKFIFKNDNDNETCIISMEPDIVIIQGKFLPRKGRIEKIEDLINDIMQQDFEENIIVDVEGFVLADSSGIMKIKKILKAITRNTKEVNLVTQKGNRFHEITMKTVLESIPYIDKVTLC